MLPLAKSLLATIHYHDIFDYPLKLNELKAWLYQFKFDKTVSTSLKNQLAWLEKKGKIGHSRGYYFLAHRQKLASLANKRQQFSADKLRQVQSICRHWVNFPWIKMVGLTGNVAMQNTDKKDDIDLLIITQANRLWLTRLLLTINLWLLGKKRSPGSDKVSNKFCTNMWLDEKALKIKSKSMYSAHELLAIQPLIDKKQTWRRLLQANKWVWHYWPNQKLKVKSCQLKVVSKSRQPTIFTKFLDRTEKIVYFLQYQFMANKITNEKISRHYAFFHPLDRSQIITNIFQKRLNKL